MKGISILICLVTLPPPYDGRNIATECFLDALGSKLNLRIVDLSPTRSVGRLYRVGKMVNTARAGIKLLLSTRPKGSALYLVANHSGGILYDTLISAIARLRGYPLIIHHHVFSYLIKPKYLFKLLMKVARPDTLHIVLCKQMRDQFKKVYRQKENVHVVSNMLSRHNYDNIYIRKHRPDNILTLGFLSNITREKGIDDIFSLANELCPKKRFRFIVAGPAMDITIRTQLDDMSAMFDDMFKWIGPVYGSAKAKYFSYIDVFLFPTRYTNEAQPLVLLEALKSGCPILVNSRGCIDELVTTECGVVVGNPDIYLQRACQWLDEIYSDPSKLEALSSGAVQRSFELELEATQNVDKLAKSLLQDNTYNRRIKRT